MTEDLNMKGNDYNIALFIFVCLHVSCYEQWCPLGAVRWRPNEHMRQETKIMAYSLPLVRPVHPLRSSKQHLDQAYGAFDMVGSTPYVLAGTDIYRLGENAKLSNRIAIIMTLWGITTIGQGLVRTNGGLQAMRFLLGLFEAGFFPGCQHFPYPLHAYHHSTNMPPGVYLISMYYKRYELQWRLSIFFTGSILAGAFSGLLAYAIAKMDGIAGYGGWRWIFIIEGIFTTVVGVAAKWFVPDWPETAKFLNAEEKELLIARLTADVADAKMNRLDRRAVGRILGDWKIYVGTAMYFGIVNTGYATSVSANSSRRRVEYRMLLRY